MDNDRELLELAAKAAGITLSPMAVKNVTEQGDDRFIGYMASHEQWKRVWFDPLADDGDALRLAVKCSIRVTFSHGQITTAVAGVGFVAERHGDDPNAATRRAIVRAAAEIGKGMK